MALVEQVCSGPRAGYLLWLPPVMSCPAASVVGPATPWANRIGSTKLAASHSMTATVIWIPTVAYAR